MGNTPASGSGKADATGKEWIETRKRGEKKAAKERMLKADKILKNAQKNFYQTIKEMNIITGKIKYIK